MTRLSEAERRDYHALSVVQRRHYRNLRESEIGHVLALSVATKPQEERFALHLSQLHVATVKIENAIEDRDDTIRSAHRDGVPAIAIAESVGLTRQRVHQIVRESR